MNSSSTLDPKIQADRQHTLDRAVAMLESSKPGERALRFPALGLSMDLRAGFIADPSSAIAKMRDRGAANVGAWKTAQRICAAFSSGQPLLPAPALEITRYRLDGNPPGIIPGDRDYDEQMVIYLERWQDTDSWYITGRDIVWHHVGEYWADSWDLRSDKTSFLLDGLESAHTAAQHVITLIRAETAQALAARQATNTEQ